MGGLLSKGQAKWARGSLAQQKNKIDFVIACKEWVPGGYNQLHAFYNRAAHEFLLTAAEHPDVRARLSGGRLSSGDGSFQAFTAQILPEDIAKVVSGVAYRIQPLNTNDTYRWVAAPDMTPLR